MTEIITLMINSYAATLLIKKPTHIDNCSSSKTIIDHIDHIIMNITNDEIVPLSF